MRTFSTAACKRTHDRWDNLTKGARQRLLASGAITPRRDTAHANATCVSLHRQLARLFAAQTVADYERIANPPRLVVLGDDWGGGDAPSDSAFSSDDTSLNNRVGEVSLTDPVGVGTQWTAQELIGSLELTDTTLREWGVELADGSLANHGPIEGAIRRSDAENTLLDIAIPFGDVSDVENGRLP